MRTTGDGLVITEQSSDISKDRTLDTRGGEVVGKAIENIHSKRTRPPSAIHPSTCCPSALSLDIRCSRVLRQFSLFHTSFATDVCLPFYSRFEKMRGACLPPVPFLIPLDLQLRPSSW